VAPGLTLDDSMSLWLDLSETWSRLLHFAFAANPRDAGFRHRAGST
jgi:hypothetical protein